ncbi:ATP-grasp domain-containing protein [Nesterenkonia flava]|uniref:Alpha-L-glutamate ligase n=1 Tax=Nesterenkonia flava TaxID=469799 RepID=A0ABU1FT80_9MICC|nr:alpha-L-glutamate ligase [Nesterenkonia flava]MDR5711867.1 alpha-L-glutamate ligase [Nesterenkonia flava]
MPGAVLDLASAPPEGVFFARLSASSHTRTDPHVKEYGRAVLAWLEAAGRTVVNGAGVYELEVSKIRQHRALAQHGFTAPRTTAVFGHESLTQAARAFTPPFITKHNQGGKGLGVRRFESHAELESVAAKFAPGGENEPVDGITLIQNYVQPAEPFITRAEFIGGRFHYAVKVDVSGGSFELCPAVVCEIPQPGLAGSACSVPDASDQSNDDRSAALPAAEQFSRRTDITAETPLIRQLEAFLAEYRIEIAGVEFIETVTGEQVVYDINTNTNYNPAVETAEAAAGRVPAARRLAQHLKHVLERDHAVR